MTERSERALILASGALAACGAGLLAYRWFVLGLSWDGGRSSLMTGLAVGAMIGGGQGVRALSARPVKTSWWSRALAALPGLALGAAIGFALAPTVSHLALHDRDLDGFTIALPDGDEHVEGQSYAAGGLRIDHVGGFGIISMVKWEAGGLFDEQTLGMLVTAMSSVATDAAPATTRFEVPAGLTSQSIEAHGKNDLWITVVPCGGRRIEVFTGGRGGRDLHTRMLASIRCHPDATRDQSAGRVPVIVDLPPGWAGQTMAPGQVGFGGASSDEGVIVQVEPGTLEAGELQRLLPKLLNAMGGKVTLGDKVVANGPAGARTLQHLTMATGDQQIAGTVTAWNCPDRGLYLVALYLHPAGADEASGRDVLLRARCARADETVPDYPAAK